MSTRAEALAARTAELVDIPSVSHDEDAIGDHIASVLAAAPWLELTRIGPNVLAHTSLSRSQRLLLAGHTDTVPANSNERARRHGGVISGLGSADMKSGLASMIELALTLPEPSVDLTFVFYACEEVEQRFSGLRSIEAERPDLLVADAAVLGEPTAALIEAGCQGVLRLAVTLRGVRAHTARPWTGRNAVHRLAPLLALCDSYEGRQPLVEGCLYREALQAVGVEGGVAGNVLPDEAVLRLNHRFAPDRSAAEAYEELVAYLSPAIDPGEGDEITLVDSAAPAAPGISHPLLAQLVAQTAAPPTGKLGWTDVSFFAARGIPAVNFGPGDPEVAHTAGENVAISEIEAVYEALAAVANGAVGDTVGPHPAAAAGPPGEG